MAESFSVGDVCEIVESALYPHHIGLEVTVMGELRAVAGWPGVFHEIRYPDGGTGDARPQCLRKKRPPPTREQTSTWDDVIVWRPREVSHV